MMYVDKNLLNLIKIVLGTYVYMVFDEIINKNNYKSLIEFKKKINI